MINYTQLPIFVSITFLILVLAFGIYWIIKNNRERMATMKFNRAIRYAKSDALDEVLDLSAKRSMSEAAVLYFPIKFKQAKSVDFNVPNQKINQRMIGLSALVFMVSLILTRMVPLAIVAVVIALVIVKVRLDSKINSNSEIILAQIPGFIEIFKSNIESNESPANALMGAIDNTAYPLHEELREARAIIELGSFQQGVKHLMLNTTNKTLRHFFSCIDLSNDVGSDLTEQIEVIQKLVEENEDLRRQKKAGISKNKSLMYVGTLALPITFILMNMIGDVGAAYWFKDPTSWILFIGMCAAVGIGLMLAKSAIDKIDV